jgi:transcriptional regulator with XRE-family HTH domain
MRTKFRHSVRDLEARFGTMTLGFFLKAFREAENLSQTEFGKRLGISRGNLCDLEKGRKIASPTRAVQLSEKMGVAPELLLKLALQDALREAKLKYRVSLEAA